MDMFPADRSSNTILNVGVLTHAVPFMLDFPVTLIR